MKIGKNGVVIGINGPNPNLIPDTSDVIRQYTYPSSSYSDKYNKQTTIIPTGTNYILSFWAKSTIAGDKVRSHYYNPNTTTTCTNSQGVTKTASDGNIDFVLTTEWQFYWVKYAQTETTAKKYIIFPRMVSGNGTGTVSITKVKFEAGDIPTEWIPSEVDNYYVSSNNGFIENDNKNVSIQENGFLISNNFIEI